MGTPSLWRRFREWLARLIFPDVWNWYESVVDKYLMTDSLQDKIFAWGMETFGPGQRREGVFAHLTREIKELGESLPSIDPDELADCTILLFELAGFAGVDLIEEVEKKFEINQGRTWGPTQPDGSILHVRKEQRDDYKT